MYAVVKTGGKQYKVAKDDKIIVDRLEAEAGAQLRLDEVLMIANGDNVTLGAPLVKDAAVGATVLRHTRGDKIMVFRRKRRKNFRRMRGHRQDLTLIQITDIAADGKIKLTSEAKKPEAKKAETKPKASAKKSAPKKTQPKASAKKPATKVAKKTQPKVEPKVAKK